MIVVGLFVGGLVVCVFLVGDSEFDVLIFVEGMDDGMMLMLWIWVFIECQVKLFVDVYNVSYENQVELIVVFNDDYVVKVGVVVGLGGFFDLFVVDIVYVLNWVEQGFFQDMFEQIDGFDFKDEINFGYFVVGMVDGVEYVFFFVFDLLMLFWNKELFVEVGFDFEKVFVMFEEFVEVVMVVQVLDKLDIYGMVIGFNCGGCLVFIWFLLIWVFGDEVMNEDGMELLFDSDLVQVVYDIWVGLEEVGVVFLSLMDEVGLIWIVVFSEGKVGVMLFFVMLLLLFEFDVGVVGIFGVDGGVLIFVGGDGIGILKDLKKFVQVWNFLNWMMFEDVQVEVFVKDGNVVFCGDFVDNEYVVVDLCLVIINEVVVQGDILVVFNFQQVFNVFGSLWLMFVCNVVLNGEDFVFVDNDEIMVVLLQ